MLFVGHLAQRRLGEKCGGFGVIMYAAIYSYSYEMLTLEIWTRLCSLSGFSMTNFIMSVGVGGGGGGGGEECGDGSNYAMKSIHQSMVYITFICQ